jgi:hypothetical protein
LPRCNRLSATELDKDNSLDGAGTPAEIRRGPAAERQGSNSAHGDAPKRCHFGCARPVQRVGFVAGAGMFRARIAVLHEPHA